MGATSPNTGSVYKIGRRKFTLMKLLKKRFKRQVRTFPSTEKYVYNDTEKTRKNNHYKQYQFADLQYKVKY